MTEKKKRVRKQKEEPATQEDRMVSAYYMLAQVVEHNTMMMKAFIDMIQAKENELQKTEPSKPAKKNPDDEKLKEVLKQVYSCAGKDTALKLLASHKAEKISDLDNAMKEAFVESALEIIKRKKGDIDERQ